MRGEKVKFTTKDEYGLFVDIAIIHAGFFGELEPWVALEAHQAVLLFAAYKEHDIAVCLLAFAEKFLLHHLCVVHEADEFPLT